MFDIRSSGINQLCKSEVDSVRALSAASHCNYNGELMKYIEVTRHKHFSAH